MVGSSQDWNPYVYCNNEPINCVDPSGYFSENFSQQFMSEQHYSDSMNEFFDEVQNGIEGAMIGMGLAIGSSIGIGAAPLISETGTFAFSEAVTLAKTTGAGVMTYVGHNPQHFKTMESLIVGFIEGVTGSRYGKGESFSPSSFKDLLNYGVKRSGRYLGEEFDKN